MIPQRQQKAEKHRFDRDTQLERIEENRFRGRVDKGWWIVKGPNGGYLAAILLRAMQLTTDQSERAPRSMSVYYLSTAKAGPIDIVTAFEKHGRSITTVTARMLQRGKPIAFAVGALGKPFSNFDFQDIAMPDVDPPEARAELSSERLVPSARRYEMVPVIGGAPWSGSERAKTGGWIRLVGQRNPDAILMAAMADAWYPSIFTRVKDGQFAGAVPTVDLTIHFRAELPLPDSKPDDFYFVRLESTTCRQGYMEETGEIWSRSGVLLVQSRQLALLF
ncbi:MAG: thioesterase family protein [Deltaproteobacteria bacterium]|nr:thioesterase family protein [Deltaproteobacteria bacterium]